VAQEEENVQWKASFPRNQKGPSKLERSFPLLARETDTEAVKKRAGGGRLRSLFVWLVLICSERKVLLAGCWWLVCCERKVLWWLISQAREKYCWLVAGGWFVVREKYCGG
jgi:hypothetical protein